MNDSSLSTLECLSPLKLFTANQVKYWDQTCVKNSFSEDLLVELSGQKIAAFIQKRFLNQEKFNILFFCGSGNNAADALVAMRCLHIMGYKVQACYLKTSSKGSKAFQRQLKICRQENLDCVEFSAKKIASKKFDLIVDGIFGVGFRPPLSPTLKKIFSWINNYGATVLSIDIPSGISSDSLKPPSESTHIYADITLCLDSFKYCLLTPFEKKTPFGEVVLLNLYIPSYIHKKIIKLNQENAYIFLSPQKLASSTKPHAHKFQKGHCLILGGSEGKYGSIQLASRAAIEMGCGWVSVAISNQNPLSASKKNMKFREGTVFEPLLDEQDQIKTNSLAQYLEKRKPNVILIGPGWTKNLLRLEHLNLLATYTQKGGTLILDAGATHNIMNLISKYKFNPLKTLLLPHPGEWKKIGSFFEDFKAGNAEDILNLQAAMYLKKIQATLVYKSSSPIVFSRHNPILVNHFPDRNAGVAGMGDVIAGICAGIAINFEDAGELFLRAHAHALYIVSKLAKNKSLIDAQSISENLHLP